MKLYKLNLILQKVARNKIQLKKKNEEFFLGQHQ